MFSRLILVLKSTWSELRFDPPTRVDLTCRLGIIQNVRSCGLTNSLRGRQDLLPSKGMELSTEKTENKNGTSKKTTSNGQAPKRKINAKLTILEDIVSLMEESGLSELHYEKGDVRIHMKRGGTPSVEFPTMQPVTTPVMVPAAGVAVPPVVAATAPVEPGVTVKSPMVGTLYRAPAPDAKPFIQEGSKVEVGQVICIIEAMKLMNEIKSEMAGKVVKVLVENGQVVEFGQPLIIVDPQG
jgi:acetyl-CoA carboxylase biotin carboxyl carrier protein